MLHFRYAEATKIKQCENLTDEYFYERKFPDLRYIHTRSSFRIEYIYIIGWVAVQYHWILDESVPYLGESEGRAKYKQDESNVQ